MFHNDYLLRQTPWLFFTNTILYNTFIITITIIINKSGEIFEQGVLWWICGKKLYICNKTNMSLEIKILNQEFFSYCFSLQNYTPLPRNTSYNETCIVGASNSQKTITKCLLSYCRPRLVTMPILTLNTTWNYKTIIYLNCSVN